jgi:hypothetical protein
MALPARCEVVIRNGDGLKTIEVLQTSEIFAVIRDHFKPEQDNKGVLINWLKSGADKCSLIEIDQRRVTVTDKRWVNRVISLYINEPDTDDGVDTGNTIEFRRA